MTCPSRPSNGHCHSVTSDSGGYPTQPNDRIPDALADLCLTQDDIVRPELRNDVMLTGGRTPHADSNHVGHATITMTQRRYGKWIRTDGQDIPVMVEKLLEL